MLNPQTGQPSIYVTLRGGGIIRVDAPFTTLQSLQLTICPLCAGLKVSPTARISVLVPALGQEIALRKRADGLYAGSIVYDGSQVSSVDFHVIIDGAVGQDFVHAVTADEKAGGVALFSNETLAQKP